MAQFSKQREGLVKLQQFVQRVQPRWLRNPADNHRTKATSARETVPLHSDNAPDRLAGFRDDELLVLIAKDEHQALGALYDRHSALVFSLALHISGVRLVAESVTQDVFHTIWHHAHAFQSSARSDSGWIVGIARASTLEKIDFQQGTLRTPGIAVDIPRITALQAGANLDHRVGFREDVRVALAALPADQRQALDLAYYGGLTTREIAVKLATSDGVVKKRLQLGLRNLADLLQSGVSREEHDR